MVPVKVVLADVVASSTVIVVVVVGALGVVSVVDFATAVEIVDAVTLTVR